jgi:hypothetical protein
MRRVGGRLLEGDLVGPPDVVHGRGSLAALNSAPASRREGA